MPVNEKIKTIINTAIYSGLLYLAAVGHTWAMVVISVLTWFGLLACVFVLASVTAQNDVMQAWLKEEPWPLWLNAIYDVAVLTVMFANCWYINGIVYSVTIACALYIRFSLKERMAE